MSSMNSVNFLSFALFCITLVKQTYSQIHMCEQEAGTFNATILHVTGCTKGVCNIRMGAWAQAHFRVTPKVASQSLITEGFASWHFVNFKLPLLNSDGCIGFKESCPWPANQTRESLQFFYIPYFWFEISPTVRFIITNEKKEVIICFEGTINLIK
ncbi:hypothetical protein RF11_12705 [Thelohanellus kitauei]|uniref:MD-2-related lipid-recognition domain-containing protein n=1 Tax=Thelohanellus kitauei TaxID=669202 RepID=A0A0C2MYI3_THEKT|nr:hypothetical protein RF11_12705 [Thelohanellus kitauei]